MNFIQFSLISLVLFTGCIGDDIIEDTVEASIRIINPIDSLKIGTTHQFEAVYLNTIGQEEAATILWSSSDENVLTISNAGEAEGLATGVSTVEAQVEGTTDVLESFQVIVSEEEVVNPGTNDMRTGTLRTTSSYTLKGDFSMQNSGDNTVILQVASNYSASSNLPGLYLYLTNNPNSVNNALEVGKVTVFNGAHSYTIEGVDLNEYSHLLYYCKPFSVKVGDGEFDN
jgi:hypothetical protein